MRKAMFVAAVVLLFACVAFVNVDSRQKGGERTNIKCPLDEIRAEITTALPDPWFQTPQIGRLQRTRIMNIGGKRTLVCDYWAYGRTVGVMREFPSGAKACVAVTDGFRCV